jgi:hypothetical protein
MRKFFPVVAALILMGALAASGALAQPRPPQLDDQPTAPGGPPPTAPGGGGGGSGGSGGGTPTLRPPGSGGSSGTVYGAIAFTADGSYATAWKRATQSDAEAHVAKECAAFGRGACRTIGFSGEYCVALVHFRSRRWRISFPGSGTTYPEAQQDAMKRCGADKRTRASQCTLRVVVCGDGR